MTKHAVAQQSMHVYDKAGNCVSQNFSVQTSMVRRGRVIASLT